MQPAVGRLRCANVVASLTPGNGRAKPATAASAVKQKRPPTLTRDAAATSSGRHDFVDGNGAWADRRAAEPDPQALSGAAPPSTAVDGVSTEAAVQMLRLATAAQGAALQPVVSLLQPMCALTAAFVAVAVDVNSPDSLHLLAGLDQSLHAWVVANTPGNHSQLGLAMSNWPIAAAMAGWAATSMAALLRSSPSAPSHGAISRVALSWLAFWTCGGVVRHGDPGLVHLLKTSFARQRPSALHHTFSFPSGHTTAAFFLVGTLLLVLLPAALQQQHAAALPQSEAREMAESSSCDQAAALNSIGSGGAAAGGVNWGAVLPVWLGAGCTVAAGRVLVDAHWLSDTMAGACLGSGLALGVYGAARVTDVISAQLAVGQPGKRL